MEGNTTGFSATMNVSGSEGMIVPEKPFQRRMDLQAHLLSFPEKFSKDATAISEKIRQSFDSRWNWGSFAQVSQQERKEGLKDGTTFKTVEDWKQKVTEWHTKLDENSPLGKQAQEVLHVLGIDTLNDAALQELLNSYSYSQNGMKLFTEKMLSMNNVEENILMVKHVAGMLFGIKISSEVVAQVVDLERNITKASGNEVELTKLEKELLSFGENPTLDTQKIITHMGSLLKNEEKNKEKNGQSEEAVTSHGAFMSDIGKDRKEQQDAGFIEEENLPQGIESLAVVADGHGEGGGIASRLASKSFREKVVELYKQNPSLPMEEILKQAISYAEQKVCENSTLGGTTLVGAVKTKDKIYIVNIGDSRAYGISLQGDMRQITKDHNWENNERRYGIMLSRSIGDRDIKMASERELSAEPDIFILNPSEVSSLILCSDGITGVLSETEIKSLTFGKSPQEAVSVLINAAKVKANLADNITAAFLKLV